MKCHVVILILLSAIPLVAQQQAPAPPANPAVPAKPAPPAAPAKPASPAAPQAPALPTPGATVVQPPVVTIDESEGGQPVNIRVDVSISDLYPSGTPQVKNVMLMLADRALGRTRAAFEDRVINIDARPVIEQGRIRLQLTVENSSNPTGFMPPDEMKKASSLNWRNSFTLLLDNGKPIVALESADTAGKRKLSVDVKATIQK
jgi:hypothetical protein